MKRLVIAAASVGAMLAGHIAAASAYTTCQPPRGGTGFLAHTADIHARGVSCLDAGRLIVHCRRFSYGSSGICTSVGYRWYCKSRDVGPLASSEDCSASGKHVAWIWVD